MHDAQQLLSLRSPAAADYTALASWVPDAAACLRWAGPNVPFPFSAEELPALLALEGSVNHCLADGAGAPRAFGQHWPTAPGTVHLGRILVAPNVRGQGVGRVLCEQLIAAAVRSTGAHTVTLMVYRDNVAAIALYTSLGFVAQEARSRADAWFMVKTMEAV